MQVSKLSREELLTWLGDGKVANPDVLGKAGLKLSKSQIALVTYDDLMAASKAPFFVVRDEEELQDFYAFVSTYVSTYVPFSAFFRVLTLKELEEIRYGLDEFGDAVKRALVGAVICESVLKDAKGGLDRILLSDCLSSESFLMAKVLVDGQPVAAERVSHRWQYCNSAFLNSKFEASASSALPFWNLVFHSVRAGGDIRSGELDKTSKVVRKLLAAPHFSDEIWGDVVSIYPDIANVRDDMTGAREKRARAFTTLVRSSELMKLGAEGDFIVGYLGVLLAGGSFEYASLISGLKGIYPTSTLWFGFLSGILRDSDVLSAGRSLGRHILRELDEPGDYLDKPDCDISFYEIRVLSRSKNWPDGVRSRSDDSVRVEVFPSSVCRFGKKQVVPANEVIKSEAISKEALGEARRLLLRLQRVLNLDAVQSRDEDLFGPGESRRKR